MFDLNEQPKIPSFQLKTTDGVVKSYDTVLISYKLRVLDAEKDPAAIQTLVNNVFEINVETWETMLILKAFTEFAEKHLEEPLKKVFERELYSATSTDSHQQSSKISSPPST